MNWDLTLLSKKQQDLRDQRNNRSAAHQLVTVVIPCYNQAHFLGEAIESVLEQTYPHYEIVVVDDGATDNTSEVASRYPGKVRLIRQENRGLSGARNTGIRHSEGEYMVFLDADDRLLPEALERALSAFTPTRSVPSFLVAPGS
jgi:glycosyltransferase involved in cell wall biosynthesis